MTVAIQLADVERPLALFAQGISGRPYRIQPEDAFEGVAERLPGAALHDPSTLYLPDTFALYGERAANVGGLRLTALHQLGYAEFGSHAFAIEIARARCAALARRTPPESGPRVSDLSLLYGHFPLPGLARALFQIIEATRIDHAMLRRYPGIRPHYARFAAREARGRTGPVLGLAGLFDALILHGLGTPSAALEARDVTGVLAPLLEHLGDLQRADADVYTSSSAMTHCYALLEPWADNAAPFEAPERPVIHGDPPLEWLQRQFRVQQWEEELEGLNELLDEALGELDPSTPDGPHGGVVPSLPAGPEGAPADVPASAARTAGGAPRPADLASNASPRSQEDARDALRRRIEMEHAALRSALGAPAHTAPSFLYDEWDAPAQRYRRAWCRLFEIPLDTLGTTPPALSKAAAPLREAVRRRFEHLRPQAFSRTRKVLEGHELDWDQLIAYRVDRHHTASPDERVYQRRDRTTRDVSALFLVDLSASTDDPVESLAAEPGAPIDSDAEAPNLRDPFDDDPFLWSLETAAERPPRRRIIDVQRDALLLMADALDRLGDRFGVFGFSGYGRDCVEFYIAKDFNAPWDARALKALAAMEPRRSTRMGPAIRHGARRLKRAGGALKVLIILSDGFPQDCDYGPDRGSHDYGVADTAQALREAERAGIETFCITVDRSGHDYLKRMCDERRYLVIDEIETLPVALSRVYEALTG